MQGPELDRLVLRAVLQIPVSLCLTSTKQNGGKGRIDTASQTRGNQSGARQVGRIIKYLIYLLILGAAALGVYALFAELPPPIEDIIIDVPVPKDS